MSERWANTRCVAILCMLPAAKSFPGPAENVETVPTLPETVVTASRLARDPQSEPVALHVIDAESAVLSGGARTTADALEGLPSVMVQKTSLGQTSPFLRGFTGYRTLCLVDGVRLNHAAFRSGPNQYWNTVDPLSIARYELVMGPGSVLYGSDAIGGVLNALTPSVPDWTGEPAWERRLYYRGASAERSHIGRVDVGARRTDRFGLRGGYSRKHFGDLRGGKDVGKQSHTGYDEQAGDFKAVWQSGDRWTATLGHQSVRQDDAWRTHRTVHGIDWRGLTRGDDYVNTFDQGRDLTYARVRSDNLSGPFSAAEATISRHFHQEDNRRVKADQTIQTQGFEVESWGGNFQAISENSVGQGVVGVDGYRDGVSSYGRKYDAQGVLKQTEIQGPLADDGSYTLLALFAQGNMPFAEDRLEAQMGLRFTYAEADAGHMRDPQTGGATSLRNDWQAAVGSLKLLAALAPERRHVAYASVSQGFRAPTLHDLSSFDVARSGEIEIAAPSLDPERFVSYEVGLKQQGTRAAFQAACYYTVVENMIVPAPTGRMQDDMVEVMKRNAGEGYVQGVELSSSVRLTAQWSVRFNAAWQDGEVETYPAGSTGPKDREYVSRLMPPAARIGVRWDAPNGRYWGEALADAAARADKLSAADARDTQRIPPGGTPGYVVGTVRAGFRLTDRFETTLAVENVADKDYRVHGSGINEPGRNILLTMAANF